MPKLISMLRCKSLSSVSTWEWSSSTRIPHHILVYRYSPFSWGQRAISSMKWTSPGHNRSICFNRGKGLLCGIKPLNTSQVFRGILCVCAWFVDSLVGEIKLSSCFTTLEVSTRLIGFAPLPWSWSWTTELSQNPPPQVITLSWENTNIKDIRKDMTVITIERYSYISSSWYSSTITYHIWIYQISIKSIKWYTLVCSACFHV